ncbi:MAG: zf-HC2 domain-containing protein [bacterium]
MNKKIKCSQVKKKISAFLDREVSEEERFNISEHLKTCLHCQNDLAKLSQVSDFLNLMEAAAVSPYFMTRLKQRIAEAESKQVLRLPFYEWVKRIAVPVGVAALFVISILGGNYLGQVLYQRELERVTALDEEVANLTGTTSFDDFSEGSLGEIFAGLLTEGGE